MRIDYLKETVALFILLLPMFIFSEVRICGIQDDDLNLKAENNPYIITGDVLIKRRTLWNINPGVIIKIASTSSCKILNNLLEGEVENKGDFITIYVRGSFQCVGSSSKRVVFEPLNPVKGKPTWYGIVFERANSDYSKIFYSDISGAVVGAKIINSSPTIRNTVFENNQTALFCKNRCESRIFNNNIINNYSTGIVCNNSTPSIFSNIIVNNQTGIWSDGLSKVDITYNNLFANVDGNFLDCLPRYGLVTKTNKRNDSCDFKKNIFVDPVFFGSKTHADSIDKDFRVQTDTLKADVEDKKLSRIIVETVPDSIKKANRLNVPYEKWQLSEYSRLKDAGYPKSKYKDADGSINDIGIHGGSEFRFE